MKVIVLNFSSPLQSWAGREVMKTRVDTSREPSKRAIQGLVAAAYGYPRVPHGENFSDPVGSLEISVFPVNEGHVQRDFQTIGDRSGEEEYMERIGRLVNDGKKSAKPLVADAQGGTAVVNRTYLGGASFLVQLKGRSDEETREVLHQLGSPVFSPYLGKKAFAPTFPFLLGSFDEDRALKVAEEKLQEIREALCG